MKKVDIAKMDDPRDSLNIVTEMMSRNGANISVEPSADMISQMISHPADIHNEVTFRLKPKTTKKKAIEMN